jgi:Protein of unknown function (DUF3551)
MEIQYEDNFDDSDCTSLVFALSVVAFDAGAAKAGPIVPRGHDCLEYAEGGTDCSFTSYAQCEATASGLAAECYGSAIPNDEHLRRQFPRVGLQQQFHTRF